MAFATTNIRAGTVGNLKLIAGDWTGSDADANGVTSKPVGRTYLANFISQDSNNGPVQSIGVTLAVNPSDSNAVIIGVANRRTTALGRFLIICS